MNWCFAVEAMLTRLMLALLARFDQSVYRLNASIVATTH